MKLKNPSLQLNCIYRLMFMLASKMCSGPTGPAVRVKLTHCFEDRNEKQQRNFK